MSFGKDMSPAVRDQWLDHLIQAQERGEILRAKFRVEHVIHYSGARNVKLSAVHDGSPENNQFSQATPSGSLEMHINNPAAFDFLEPGKNYYLDFIQAPD